MRRIDFIGVLVLLCIGFLAFYPWEPGLIIAGISSAIILLLLPWITFDKNELLVKIFKIKSLRYCYIILLCGSLICSYSLLFGGIVAGFVITPFYSVFLKTISLLAIAILAVYMLQCNSNRQDTGWKKRPLRRSFTLSNQ